MELIKIEDYYSIMENNKYYNRALARTNLNCKVLMKRFRKIDFRKNEVDYSIIGSFKFIIWNHIIQAYSIEYGVDIIPGSCGDMYGYYVSIEAGEDREKVANLTSGSLRIDSYNGVFEISKRLKEEKDLYITVLKAMKHLENNILDYGNETYKKVKGHKGSNNDVYLSVYQVLTMGCCMGLVEDFILGINYLPDYFREVNGIKYLDYFSIKINKNQDYHINKNSGDIFHMGKKLIDYKHWCNGEIGQGIKTIIKLTELEEKYLIFTASVGGYTGNSFKIEINFIAETCKHTKFDYGYSNEKTNKVYFDKNKMSLIIRKLFKIISKWEKEYKAEDAILDGTSWSVGLITNKKVLFSSGNNTYPKDWNLFSDIISKNIGDFY